MLRNHKRGFSTILAILLTAFLVILASGILSLFLSEGRINRSVYNGMAGYALAEGGIEYAMLKIKNHKEGFQDVLAAGEDVESKVFKTPASENPRAGTFGYSIAASGNVYSGSVDAKGFEIIPLFSDVGMLEDPSSTSLLKHPSYSDVARIQRFHIENITTEDPVDDGLLVWNVLGNDIDGATYGIVGTGSKIVSFGNMPESITTTGSIKKPGNIDPSTWVRGETTATGVSIVDFMNTYTSGGSQFGYLVLFNPGNSPVKYTMKANADFSYPKLTINGVGQVGDTVTNLEFSESRSRYFDALKYSFFNP